MQIHKFLIYIIFCFLSVLTTAQIKSPEEFLPNYGKQVSYYHQVEDYFEHLTLNSNQIKHYRYGVTYQERNLNVYFISSSENIKNLDIIRQNHLYEIGLYPHKDKSIADKNIIWLSFNVHGNEIGAIESSLSIAYELLNPNNQTTQKWLQDVVIILDPCLNPDGFSRYANWLRDISGRLIHTGLSDREHMEPWPGGRQNHYQYDLNRDWAWQVQLESRLRMNLYHEWMPMVHADVHEMGFNEPYFFPPAAEPIHEQIRPFQKDFHKKIGELTSKKFDREGWMYYSGERFDLFYPSYGDTYPSFNGAIGMTYEQGGIGAGRAVQTKNGDVLTLRDRIEHHKKALLAVVELSDVLKNELRKNFKGYFKESRTKPKGKYKTYIVKNNPKNQELIKMLNLNRIESSFANETIKMTGYHYQSDSEKTFLVETDDLIIDIDQPRAVLTQILFEPHHKLSDSLSYDITAWALPFAYGTEAYALKSTVNLKTKKTLSVQKSDTSDKNVYAFYIPWNNRQSVQILSQLHKKNIKVRSAQRTTFIGNTKIERGGLIIAKGDNVKLENFDKTVFEIITHKNDFQILETGFSEHGGDLGGEYFPLLISPKILLLGGAGISSTDFGQVWHYLEQVAEYPLSIVEIQNMNRINWQEYNTLILPDGWYNLTDSQQKMIYDFIAKGGKVIAIDRALNLFEDKEGFNLTAFATEEEQVLAKNHKEKLMLSNRYLDYEGYERRAISQMISGAILENSIDQTHPLTFGLGEKYFSLKTSDKQFKLLNNAHNVIYVPKNFKSFGFVGTSIKKHLEETVTFAVDRYGKGKVIYMIDNPLFRGFWENGNLLFSNALFLVE